MFVIVSYDIVDNRKRSKMAELLLDYGKRVQKSVFECNLDAKNLSQMTDEALRQINPEKDSLRIYHLCEGCLSKIESYGQPVIKEEIMIV